MYVWTCLSYICHVFYKNQLEKLTSGPTGIIHLRNVVGSNISTFSSTIINCRQLTVSTNSVYGIFIAITIYWILGQLCDTGMLTAVTSFEYCLATGRLLIRVQLGAHLISGSYSIRFFRSLLKQSLTFCKLISIRFE